MEQMAWEGPRWLYAALVVSCVVVLFGKYRLMSKPKPNVEKTFNHSPPAAFVVFQRKFLSVFFLFSLSEGLQSVYGEALYESYGYARWEIGCLLLVSYASSLFLGTFLGAAADSIGHKRACVICGLLQLTSCFARGFSEFNILCLANVCRGLAVSLFSSASEAWLIAEHERLGFRQKWLCRTFWLMSFGMGIAAIGTGAFANLLLDRYGFGFVALPTAAAAVAALFTFLVSFGWVENAIKVNLSKSLLNACHSLTDKRVLLLGWSQACFDVTISLFWFLWTPTLISDGREIHTGIIYSYFMASLMLGVSLLAYYSLHRALFSPASFLSWIFVVASISLFIPAYDYQEIGVLVTAFCVFHVCVGIAWPFLAHLRSTHILSDRYAGVLSLYRVPVSIGVLFILIKGGLMRHLENSHIFYVCCLGLLSGAAALHRLNTRWRLKPSGEEFFSELHRLY